MQRRSFVRSSLATALFAPGALSLPRLARAAEAAATPLRSQAPPIRLSSNENPLGLPQSAKDAIANALAQGHHYPGLGGVVTERIATKIGVQPNNIVLGNGSAETLQVTVQALSAGTPGVRVIVPDPTFEQVNDYAAAMKAEVVRIPLLPDHTHDLQRMKDAVAASRGPVMVFICNPNNPTGGVTSCDAVAQWLRSERDDVWFLIDEAYFEFVEDPAYRTFIADAVARPNTVVSRTFSKIYGMAGVRLGYGVAHPDTARRIAGYNSGTNINGLALAAGLACLEDDAFVRQSLDVNRRGRDFAYRTLRELDLDYLPSHANFVMHRINGELRTYIDRMRAEGINVGRQFPPMLTYNRVSIGLPQEMEAWAAALHRFRRQGWV